MEMDEHGKVDAETQSADRKYLNALTERIYWLEGRCSGFGKKLALRRLKLARAAYIALQKMTDLEVDQENEHGSD